MPSALAFARLTVSDIKDDSPMAGGSFADMPFHDFGLNLGCFTPALLREALSQGPADVLEVEQQARSAGLLGDNQRLRQSKVFRMARQALGVLYRREGFGTGARYVLSLPAASCAPSNPMRAPLQDRAHMHSQGAHDEGEQR